MYVDQVHEVQLCYIRQMGTAIPAIPLYPWLSTWALVRHGTPLYAPLQGGVRIGGRPIAAVCVCTKATYVLYSNEYVPVVQAVQQHGL